MIRALKVAGLVLAVLMVTLVILFSWMIGTQSGSRFAVARAEGLLPQGVKLGTVHGRLSDRLEIEDVRARMEGLDVQIGRVWLEWSPGKLLGGHLQIAELGASGVRYQALPEEQPAPPAEPFSLPERVELPFTVTLGLAHMEDVQIRAAPDGEPMDVDRVAVTGASFADARLTVEALELRSPQLRADGRLELSTADTYPLDARLAWHLTAEGFAPVDGVTELGGSLAALEIDQRLAGPYHTRAAGTVTGLVVPDEPMTISLQLTTRELALADVGQQLPEATLTADAAVDGPLDALEVRADMSGTDAHARRFEANLHALVAGDAITIRELAVRQPEREGRLTGQGQIALAREVTADLSMEWQSLRWPLTGEPSVVSPRGSLSFEGPLDDYRLSVDTRLEAEGAPSLALRLDGSGDMESAQVALEAEAGGGNAEGRLSAAWAEGARADVSLRIVELDPSLIAADWPGSVSLDLEAAGRMEGETVRVTVSQLEAEGKLRDQPLSLTARGRYVQEPDRFRAVIDDLEGALGASRISVRGHVAERADLHWQLSSDDLSSLIPEGRGRISGSGRVTGPLPRVSLQTELQASDLAYADAGSLAELDLDAEVDLSGESDSRLTLTVRQAIVGGTDIQRLAVEGAGRPGGHRFRAALEADAGRANMVVEGRVEEPWGERPAWHYTLSRGELAYGQLAPWQLAGSASGLITAEQVQVERQCWQSSDAAVCLQGQGGGGEIAGELEVNDLRFAYFGAFLPENVEIAGAADASARLSHRDDGVLTAKARMDTTAGALTLPMGSNGDPVTVRLEPSRVTLDVDDSRALGQLALDFEHGQLRARAATSASVVTGADGADVARPVSDETLTGRVQLDVPELAFLSEVLPDVNDVQGRMAGDLQLGGTLGAPTLAGSLDLTDGAVTVPEPGITLEALSASLQGRGRELALQASASSGGGTLRLDGLLRLPGQPPAAQLAITGNEFEVMDNTEAQVLISPDLEVEAGAERIRITGRVHVPEAAITPGARSPAAVTASEDQVLVSEDPEQETAAARDLYAEVRLTLGDQVRFEGFGLTAQIDGDVLVDQQPETPTTATGELRIVEGEYRAYGQGLVIDSGRIYFAGGPVTQPALDVRAVRRPAEDILVGARVEGTLESPTFELFSEPPMTQQQQLSWLVLGRSLENTPDGQESALSRAALAMGIRGGDFLARNIGEELGLDQVGIETGSGEAGAPSDPGEAALVVGKYLSPKLYVSYGIGLFNPESVLEMQYEISRSWKLVTQSSGDSTGADVLYTVEVGDN